MSDQSAAGSILVSALVSDAITRVRPDASLVDVACALEAADVGAVVVGDGDRPVGILSERDIVRAIVHHRDLDETAASDVATTELVWCDASATVAEVAMEMCDQYVRHVLVEEDGALVGIVSARDLLGVYAAADMDLENDG
jgi:CBS domain-containing protein